MSENVQITPATIKIKKNFGITHALQDLVNEMIKNKTAELTDGKITAQEWNAVLDKLTEIQENRKASNQPSIFTGGTDKSKAGWHTSFVVHPDQEIAFTAEETAQIYAAMGVTIKNAPADPVDGADGANEPADPVDGADGANEPAGPVDGADGANEPVGPVDGADDANDSADNTENANNNTPPTAPQQKSASERLAANPLLKVNEPPEGVTAKQGKDSKGFDCEIWTDKDGREVKRIYGKDDSENSYSVLTEYGNDGKKIAELETQFGEPVLERERQYDANEKMTKTTSYEEDGKTVNCTYTYEYKDGKMSKETCTRGDGTVGHINEYDANEKLTKRTSYKEDGKTVNWTYTYEYKDGKMSKQTYIRGDGTVGHINEYDANEKLTKRTSYKEDGKTVESVFNYKTGLYSFKRIATKDVKGKVLDDKYEFNENGVCTKSDLADRLYEQIDSWKSMNSTTINILKQLKPDNVIKVLTAYNALAGKTLQKAIEGEWDFTDSKPKMQKLVKDALDARLKELGYDPAKVDLNNPKVLAEVAKKDNKT